LRRKLRISSTEAVLSPSGKRANVFKLLISGHGLSPNVVHFNLLKHSVLIIKYNVFRAPENLGRRFYRRALRDCLEGKELKGSLGGKFYSGLIAMGCDRFFRNGVIDEERRFPAISSQPRLRPLKAQTARPRRLSPLHVFTNKKG